MADYENSIFGNLPQRRRGAGVLDDERPSWREVLSMRNFDEGPLPPRPHVSGKGGPSINQGSKPPVVTGHRYWQLDMTAVGAGTTIAIAELQFRTTAGTPLLFSGGTASASSTYDTPYAASMAADNNPATFWNSAVGALPDTWTYDYGAGNAKAIVEITMQARPDVSYNEAPTVFTPQWSDDGVTWTSMAQITTAPWTAAGQIQTFAVTSASTTSVWSASDAAANAMTLSNGGLTVQYPGAANWVSIRGSINKSSGKLYVELKYAGDAAAIGYAGVGFANAGFNATGELGGSNYSGGWQLPNFGSVSTGFTSSVGLNLSVAAANDVIGLAIDFTAQGIWASLNNVWQNSNPVAGTNANMTFIAATVGALFPAISFHGTNGASGGTWTLQPTAASQKYAPPSGFSPWG